MALPDLLWACPLCHADTALRNPTATCSSCGVRFERADQAHIRAVRPDGTGMEASAADWVDRLPDPASLLENDDPVRQAAVTLRTAETEAKVYGAAGYLNRIEVFGEETPGALTLHLDRLRVAREGEEPTDWPLASLTAIQASSSDLQLKHRDAPLTAVRFLDDSVYLWLGLLQAAVRDFYGRTGRGTVVEFQPRISTR